MRAVIQRVNYAHITIDGSEKKSIGQGIVILLGIEAADNHDDIQWLCSKITKMRIFDDTKGKMNFSLQDIDGQAMLVSQFTLHASTKKGNRPSWINAAGPEQAEPMYLECVKVMQGLLKKDIICGKFAAHMDIELLNDGPVTIIIDSKRKE